MIPSEIALSRLRLPPHLSATWIKTINSAGYLISRLTYRSRVLLVLPEAPDLNLAKERAVIEQALVPLDGALRLDVLDGIVTRTRFAKRACEREL